MEKEERIIFCLFFYVFAVRPDLRDWANGCVKNNLYPQLILRDWANGYQWFNLYLELILLDWANG